MSLKTTQGTLLTLYEYAQQQRISISRARSHLMTPQGQKRVRLFYLVHFADDVANAPPIAIRPVLAGLPLEANGLRWRVELAVLSVKAAPPRGGRGQQAVSSQRGRHFGIRPFGSPK